MCKGAKARRFAAVRESACDVVDGAAPEKSHGCKRQIDGSGVCGLKLVGGRSSTATVQLAHSLLSGRACAPAVARALRRAARCGNCYDEVRATSTRQSWGEPRIGCIFAR